MCEKREPSSIIAARLSFSIACPVMVILCFTALSTKTEGFPGFSCIYGFDPVSLIFAGFDRI